MELATHKIQENLLVQEARVLRMEKLVEEFVFVVTDETLFTFAAAVLLGLRKIPLLLALVLQNKSIKQLHALRFVTDTANLLKFIYVGAGIGLRRLALCLLSQIHSGRPGIHCEHSDSIHV